LGLGFGDRSVPDELAPSPSRQATLFDALE
jgi:hypothetical protein